MRASGLVLSCLDGTERVYSLPEGYAPLRSYSYREFMGPVKDQGMSSTCVAQSIGYVLEWFWRVSRRPGVFDVDELYSRRAPSSCAGMSLKEALTSLVDIGYTHSGVVERLDSFVLLRSRSLMEAFLVADGPFVLGLPVFDSRQVDFWHGASLEGFHSVVCTGFSADGLELLNSWGAAYGDAGYSILSWEDVGLIQEAWGLKF